MDHPDRVRFLENIDAELIFLSWQIPLSLLFKISASEPWRAAAAVPRLATDIMMSAPFTSSELSQSTSLSLLKLLLYEA